MDKRETSPAPARRNKPTKSDISIRIACIEALSRSSLMKLSRKRSATRLGVKQVARYLRHKTGSPLHYKSVSRYLKTLPSPELRQSKLEACDDAPSDLADDIAVVPMPSSMSKRRIASKIPALNCVVEIPPASNFVSTDHTDWTYLQTPLDQIMHTPDGPPDLCRPRASTACLKPKSSILTTIRPAPLKRLSIDPNAELDSPYVPFTPQESPSSRSSPTLELANKFNKMDIPNGVVNSASPSHKFKATAYEVPWKLSHTLPRRLSYKSALPSTSSPLTPNTFPGLLPPIEGNNLASPVTLRTSYLPGLQPVTPLPVSGSSGVSGSPAGYF
ncbi:hypothetical protein EUX98_g1223 [Antrodiella citrinella]|uniref:Uncharacterized protein n=1 Tax=Antrodiella citrinella TaxID=2447956 RepID=A0A4S4NAK5_9APHY|nr:hypothetical protein EUX98_g1223 [Antrodiella citrinella]